jgi:hypothetical protein
MFHFVRVDYMTQYPRSRGYAARQIVDQGLVAMTQYPRSRGYAAESFLQEWSEI